MTPKEKAQELVYEFSTVLQQHNEAIKCALIFVKQILTNSTHLLSNVELYYWNEVQKEIYLL